MSIDVDQFLSIIDFYSAKHQLRAHHICKVLLHVDFKDVEIEYSCQIKNADTEECYYQLSLWKTGKLEYVIIRITEKLSLSITYQAQELKRCKKRKALQQAQWINDCLKSQTNKIALNN